MRVTWRLRRLIFVIFINRHELIAAESHALDMRFGDLMEECSKGFEF